MQSWDLKGIETPGGSRSPVVLHSEPPGRAVLIGLDPRQELGDHQVKEHAWLLVVDGSVEVGAGDEVVAAEAGSLFHFQPDERHAVAALEDGARLLLVLAVVALARPRGEDGARLLLVLAPWPGEGHYRED